MGNEYTDAGRATLLKAVILLFIHDSKMTELKVESNELSWPDVEPTFHVNQFQL